MYARNLLKSEFWLGEVNAQGEITGFTDFKLAQPLPRLLGGENMFYYVHVEDNDGELDVHVVQWYMAFAKQDMKHRSVAQMVEQGLCNPIEAANKLMQVHKKRLH